METGCASDDSKSSAVVVVDGVPNPKALVVDDNSTVRFVNSTILKKEGYVVETASDGAEAVAKFKDGNIYKLMVIDWDMPNKTGPQAVKEIRGLPHVAANSDIFTIVGLTDRSSAEEVSQFLDAGADVVWTKPLTRDMIKSLNK